jgi:hypothetical protein
VRRKASWGDLGEKDEEFGPALARIQKLRELGLTGKHVVAHFIRHSIAPLQRRSHPMWEFQGTNNPTHLWVGLLRVLERPVLTEMMNKLCGGTGDLESLPPGVIPLYCDRANLDAVVVAMPECGEWGIVSTWVSPYSSSGNVPLARGRSDHDSDIEEVPPPEATGSGRRRRISTPAEREHRLGPSSSTGGSSSGGAHRAFYDDDDDDDVVPLACRHRVSGVEEPPVPSPVTRPIPKVSSTPGSSSRAKPDLGPSWAKGTWSLSRRPLR